MPPLQVQKNHREIEIIVQECILNTLRDSIPVEAILKAYMDESVEEDVTEEVNEEIIDEPIKQPVDIKTEDVVGNLAQEIQQIPPMSNNRLSFNDIDYVKNSNGAISNVNAPKNIQRLEEISNIRTQQRKQDDDDDDTDKLTISSQSFNLDALDIHNIEEPSIELLPDLLLDEIEVLD